MSRSCRLASDGRDAVAGRDRGSERASRVVEPGPDRAVRHAEDVGDLAQRQPDVVMEHDHGSVLGSQLGECAIELVAKIGVGVRIGTGRCRLIEADLADTGASRPA